MVDTDNNLIQFLSGSPWFSMSFSPPAPALSAVGMLIWEERIMLSWLASTLYKGVGEIAELGAFIGTSSVALASGLELNTFLPSESKSGRIHTYDRFFGDFEARWIRDKTKFQVSSDNRFFHIYQSQTAAYQEFLSVNDGDLLQATWIGSPIEILFVDIMKSTVLTDKVVKDFFPHLIPGKSILVMQDYIFQVLPYSSVVMEHFADYFERVGDTGRNSVLFVNIRPIPPEMTRNFHYVSIPEPVRLHYLFQALGKQRTHLQRECIAHQISDFITGKFR